MDYFESKHKAEEQRENSTKKERKEGKMKNSCQFIQITFTALNCYNCNLYFKNYFKNKSEDIDSEINI